MLYLRGQEVGEGGIVLAQYTSSSCFTLAPVLRACPSRLSFAPVLRACPSLPVLRFLMAHGSDLSSKVSMQIGRTGTCYSVCQYLMLIRAQLS
jgi:hypothetical protein